MQTILKRLLNTVQLPLMELPKGAPIKSEDFERVGPGGISMAEYQEFKNLIKALPRKKNILVKTLEEKLNMTNACLSSYIEFKRQALALLIRASAGRAAGNNGAQGYAGGGGPTTTVDQDEYLETQSSLDEDN
jgi:hypothetical protein